MASPRFIVVTSQGEELGIDTAFTTTFNKNRTLKKSWRTKAIFPGNHTSSFENLSIQKQLYGHDLLKTTWPYLDNRNYEIVRLDSSRKIKKNDINISLVSVSAPETIEYALQQLTLLSSDSFLIREIEQDWFYVKKKI